MLFRKLGPTGKEVSILGFGCMRFPIIDGKTDQIDEEKAANILRYAIDHGVNYVDTAYPYHGGMSEPFIGKALRDGYREKVYLATKLPSWLIKTREDMDHYLNEQLNRLQTKYIDFYLVHTLTKKHWKNLKNLGVLEFLDSAIADGRIKYAGFSFHDEVELFKEIVDAYDWTFCQIQYNYMDENYQAGKEGLKYAAQRGLGIVIMEPLRGGKLAHNIPKDIQEIWDRSDIKRSPVEWALRFLWDQPEIDVVLSGMGDMAHVVENIKVANEANPNTLTHKEKLLIDEVKNMYNDRMKINCTSCQYCMPCPAGVNIPVCFTHYNNAFMYNDLANTKDHYHAFVGKNEQASKCIQCGECEKVCPQHIAIAERLEEVVKTLEE